MKKCRRNQLSLHCIFLVFCLSISGCGTLLDELNNISVSNNNEATPSPSPTQTSTPTPTPTPAPTPTPEKIENGTITIENNENFEKLLNTRNPQNSITEAFVELYLNKTIEMDAFILFLERDLSTGDPGLLELSPARRYVCLWAWDYADMERRGINYGPRFIMDNVLMTRFPAIDREGRNIRIEATIKGIWYLWGGVDSAHILIEPISIERR
jgi:hypothetical protein